jgi:ADP-ribose pyrophosphatase YjhB (NUDIX family)
VPIANFCYRIDPAYAIGVCRLTQACPRSRAKAQYCGRPKRFRLWRGLKIRSNGVLSVRQAAGFKFWTLPGGKVKRGESLVKALKREVREETRLHIQVGSLLGVLDRGDKDAITLRFAAIPNMQSSKAKQRPKEIQKTAFQTSLPNKASPSVKYFWSARRGPIKKVPKIRASTHQFPMQATDEYPKAWKSFFRKSAGSKLASNETSCHYRCSLKF